MTTNSKIQAIERATNRSWDEWLKFMDKIGAKDLNHHEIASKLIEELNGKVDNLGWWAQATAVAYEQYIGRRIPGQRPDGTFQTSVSKATKFSMKELMDKWSAFAAKDEEILNVITADVRVSGTENRITWRTKAKDGWSIMVISEPKGKTASIVVQLVGLQTQELNTEAKEKWAGIVKHFLADI